MSVVSKRPVFVLKFSGKIIIDEQISTLLINDIISLHKQEIDLVIVHGAGTLITELCNLLNVPVKFVNGQRVTDEKVLEIVQMVMLGKVNPSLVCSLNNAGLNSLGLSGYSSNFLQARPLTTSEDLGFVGEVTEVNTELISLLLAAKIIPVIAPLAVNNSGQAYNINADYAAAKIATALGVNRLYFFSDVNGLYDNLNDENSRIDYLSKEDLRRKISDKTVTDGMLPKLQCSLNALENGVQQVCILDCKIPGNLRNSVNNASSVGTTFA